MKASQVPANVTVSSTGRRLPTPPSWWKGAEAADVSNRVAAAALAELPGKK